MLVLIIIIALGVFVGTAMSRGASRVSITGKQTDSEGRAIMAICIPIAAIILIVWAMHP